MFDFRVMAALLIVGLAGGGCDGQPARAPGEPPPQLVAAGKFPAAPLVSCGSATFPADVIDGPIVDDLPGAEFDALREAVANLAPEFPRASKWRVADRKPDEILLLGEATDGYVELRLRLVGGRWSLDRAGECDLHMVLSSGIRAAQWWLDPRLPPPMADATVLEILLRERTCAGGSYATGRIVSSGVLYTADMITIVVGVREIGGTCLGNPNTPASVILNEPVGSRMLLDAYHVPPAPAAPPD